MSKKKNHRHLPRLPRIQKRIAPGSAPGTLSVPHNAHPSTISVINYTQQKFVKKDIPDVAGISKFLNNQSVTWVNINGLASTEMFRELSQLFGIHRLAMEDVVNVHQRAKVDAYDDQVFIVLRMVRLNADELDNEQVSIFLGENFVLTIQEKPGDCFDTIRNRLKESLGRIREAGADYLAYALIDAVIDGYFPVVDEFGERMEQLDDQLSRGESGNYMERIHHLRGDLMALRRAIRPLRDALISLKPETTALITSETRVYLRDCYDHTIQLVDLLDTYREMCSNLRDYQMTIISNRMNEVMKVLTIIGTIFIPLGFVAGLYGMNFDTKYPANMPELAWPYGYPFAISLMAVMAFGMLTFFWRKGWFSSH